MGETTGHFAEACGHRAQARGFTLLELMIVVTVVGILAAIAIPAYQNYVVRAKVSEGFAFASAAKAAVAEAWIVDGRLPESNAEAGLSEPDVLGGNHVRSVEVLEGGVIRITFGVRPIRDETVTLSPEPTGGSIRWRCAASLPAHYLPAACRGGAGAAPGGGAGGGSGGGSGGGGSGGSGGGSGGGGSGGGGSGGAGGGSGGGGSGGSGSGGAGGGSGGGGSGGSGSGGAGGGSGGGGGGSGGGGSGGAGGGSGGGGSGGGGSGGAGGGSGGGGSGGGGSGGAGGGSGGGGPGGNGSGGAGGGSGGG
ncbi:pilin, partial [Algiphilus sp.]|uniref:pilin n=1 Tax=Algiphilus sp. TaxID=1872431 RepID=UPI0025BE7FCE